MRKPNILDYEFDQTRFRGLLVTAIGDQTQAMFAKKAGVSLATITHQLTGFRHTPPSPENVISIARASEERVDWRELLSAAGYNPEKYIDLMKSSQGIPKDLCYEDIVRIADKLIMTELLRNFNYGWRVSKDVVVYHEADIRIELTNCPLDTWYFRYYIPALAGRTGELYSGIFRDEIRRYEERQKECQEGIIKYTAVVFQEDLYERLRKEILENDLLASILYIDVNSDCIVKEMYANTRYYRELDTPDLMLVERTTHIDGLRD